MGRCLQGPAPLKPLGENLSWPLLVSGGCQQPSVFLGL